jgi:hypothetical protein
MKVIPKCVVSTKLDIDFLIQTISTWTSRLVASWTTNWYMVYLIDRSFFFNLWFYSSMNTIENVQVDLIIHIKSYISMTNLCTMYDLPEACYYLYSVGLTWNSNMSQIASYILSYLTSI